MTTIALEGLTKRFESTPAVDDVSLVVPAGELYFILGPSGCGKTTLLRLVAGFIEPDAGRIRFDERDVTDLPPNKRNTGMVFQSYALWPHMTVLDNVAYGLRVRRVATPERRDRGSPWPGP
ncbi:MAG: ABC transporter ATP-binding protein [Planctomycetota bacterium]|jgi:iron(III) transport system ATP-binding protein